MAKRRSAEDLTAELKRLAERSTEDRDRAELLHEVHVYQEELTVQNDQLMHAQSVLEEVRDRFIELYDFAPIGYLTLDANGIVQQINLTGASLLGRQRHALEGMPLLGFIVSTDRPRFLDLMRRCRACKDGASAEAELTLALADGPRAVQMICKPRHNRSTSRREYLSTMVDITERRRLEAESARVIGERAALASRLISIQDDERQRIARDLHDNLGQQATALRLKLEQVAHLVTDPRVLEGIGEVQRMCQELDRQLGFIAAELRPSALDLGIVPALDRYVREWSRTFDVSATFRAVGMERLRLTPEAETHVYRVAQEALNNVKKHAEARHVNVILQPRDKGVLLLVEDDGKGFDAHDRTHAAGAGGFGLIGMRERAGLVAGSVTIESSPGRGATVLFYAPLGSRAQARAAGSSSRNDTGSPQ